MTPTKKAAVSTTSKSATAAGKAKAPAAGKAAGSKAAASAKPSVKPSVKKEAVKSAVTTKTTAKKITKAPTKASADAAKAPAKAPKAPVKAASGPTPVPPAAARPAPKKPSTGPYAKDVKFLDEQRDLLLSERAIYQGQAADLKAEADSLAQEREPGDVQFDEESGEGGTVTVDRERDLALSAQALAAVEEIDDALTRITKKTYGACERCQQPIPKPRLRALPFARLCVACKSGGLSRR
ncbi:MAG TPA: TraR/DksA C4-type zinc finger protein [Acidimicrobiales bacterium]|nr:TraR/DksA C4-type zinc finger protein [Acidimicrobiales bacterium]